MNIHLQMKYKPGYVTATKGSEMFIL